MTHDVKMSLTSFVSINIFVMLFNLGNMHISLLLWRNNVLTAYQLKICQLKINISNKLISISS